MNVFESGALFFLRPRIVHSTPGRLRLYVPLLKQWGSANGALVSVLARLFSGLEGIHEVSPCTISGNVLIRYDAKRMCENELLTFAQALTQIFFHHRDELLGAMSGDLGRLESRLSDWLHGVLSHRLYLNNQLRIPENVFK